MAFCYAIFDISLILHVVPSEPLGFYLFIYSLRTLSYYIPLQLFLPTQIHVYSNFRKPNKASSTKEMSN